jgi:DNA repair protein RadA/Sms
VRQVAHSGLRLKEAARLGFARAVSPSGGGEPPDSGINVNALTSLDTLVADIAARGGRSRPAAAA